MANQIQETELIEGCKRGERDAQYLVYERYAPSMLAVAARYCKSVPEAEDVLQEAFVKIFQKIDSFQGSSTLGAWIKRIVINTAINSQRRKLYEQPMADISDYNYHDSKDITLSQFSFQELLQMIQALPMGCQTIFNLYAIEGYTHKEIAQRLDISEGTSKSQYARAKSLLQKQLKEEEERVYEKAI